MSRVSAEPTIDELLERAVGAINNGDRVTADSLAGQVLAADSGNRDAEDLLSTPTDSGEIRRLTMLVADLVDSTALSTRIEPEVYRTVVGGYRDIVHRVVTRYEGHIGSTKGDGLLAVFGHPMDQEDDVHRAVLAGIDITREVAALARRSTTASVSTSTSESGSTAAWSISTSPRTMSTASAPISRRASAAWPGPVTSPCPWPSNGWSATISI